MKKEPNELGNIYVGGNTDLGGILNEGRVQSVGDAIISPNGNIITTDPISDIRRVSKVMIDFNLNAIPVVNEEDIILGVVSRHDIVKAVSSIPHLQIWA